ncbi:poly-beta-1,6-N-acetyl-D-glucosamine N-deacetylase PgaB [Halomonas halmophila]|uniref:Poly-beta-1,6-N-acetyl-D-glucosamine N-deacetylase PgaB n=1 Tax=Halomonas halmophila TaxID=252 RepID=A0A4Y4F463_9GAMM|nr:poly-beta-1,6-N-acetyl-D-glucosamine N-deacetylase PgaB [Halomonas halmophila]GED23525.1 poly-beta-1,6-N-acetyl-D-glucosamine N-deacetylase PgaB [Halomonas halmophila]
MSSQVAMPNFRRVASLMSMASALLAVSLLAVAPVLADTREQAQMSTEYTVLSYHDIVDLTRTPDLKIYPQTITRNRLIQQFNLIDDLGYNPVSLQDILDAEAGKDTLPPKPVLLTFDDGYSSVYDIVLPLLELYDYPAVVAPVGSWLAVPEGGEVPYGQISLPRERFLSWAQLRELQASPLVEIATHTYDLHKGIIGNPQGNQLPAAGTPQWSESGYESVAAYRQRIHDDLERARDQLENKLGEAPRSVIWPYGGYSHATIDIAAELGMPHTLSLLARPNKLGQGTDDINRYLIDQETSLETFEEYLGGKIWHPADERVIHVDLDYVYDPDPAQQRENLGKLLDKVKAQDISTVYLQAFADADGNGVAESLYFPNDHLPMRADLFNRVAWQLKKRVGVSVYAWMPVMAFDLGDDYSYVSDVRLDKPNPERYRRLSPFVERNRQVIADIYKDLGYYAKFDGLLFHDDGLLSDFEDASPAALAWYQEKWGLPGSVEAIRQDDDLMARWTQRKTEFLIDFTHQLADEVRRYRMYDTTALYTARNVYAPVVLNPKSEQWFAQELEAFSRAYDYTAVMAMPYMEGAEDADAWLKSIAEVATQRVDPDSLVFELQAQDWRDHTPVPSDKLAHWMRTIREAGINQYGYYPYDFHNDHPDAEVLRREFSLGTTLRKTP